MKSVDVNAGAENNIDDEIPASTTDKLVSFAADVSMIKGLFIVSSLDLLLQTNSGSAPANTFTMTANVPFLWILGDAALRDTEGAVVTTDITGLYATNEDADLAATLQIRCLVDPTV